MQSLAYPKKRLGINRLALASVGLVLGLVLCLRSAGARIAAWAELKGEHFIVYYEGQSHTFAEKVLRESEFHYDEIADAMGYEKRSQFWLWKERCLVYLYRDREAFYSGTKQPEWSNGYSIPDKRSIVSYVGAREFFDSVLPHEMAHLIFREFIGLKNHEIPKWLDEGLAVAQEAKKRSHFDNVVRQMIKEKSWTPFREMNGGHSLKGVFSDEAVRFYAQAQSMVRFLLAFASAERFEGLCRDLRDGCSLDEALRKNYPKDFRTVEMFESKWAVSYA